MSALSYYCGELDGKLENLGLLIEVHKKMHEIYIVLEGEGYMELDGDKIPVRPLSSILIKPGCRHRAVGDLKIINVPIPAFDPADEWFD